MMQGDPNRPLRLVADPYPPYQYVADGQVVGLDHDFIAAAFHAVGFGTTTRLLAWPLCLQAMRDGAADAIFQITPTPAREEWLTFSRAFRLAQTLLYQLAGNGIEELPAVELPALALERRIGVLEGFSYATVIDDLPNKVEAPSDAALLAALRSRDIHFAVIDEGVAQYLLADDRDVLSVAGFCVTRPLHLACRRESPEIVAAFDAGLDAISGAGDAMAHPAAGTTGLNTIQFRESTGGGRG